MPLWGMIRTIKNALISLSLSSVRLRLLRQPLPRLRAVVVTHTLPNRFYLERMTEENFLNIEKIGLIWLKSHRINDSTYCYQGAEPEIFSITD